VGATNRWWKAWHRYIGFVISMCNVWFGLKLKRTIESFEPTIVWYHSIKRYVGWLPIHMTKNLQWKKRMMYHDLGFFHPFPHAVSDEKQLPKQSWLFDWIRSSNSRNPFVWLAITGKRISVQILKKYMKEFDLQLVPSSFLQKYAKKFSGVQTATLPHFVQTKK
jgi:hypothetical protein